jgi:membrane associated rhomboid family serine protease
VIPLRDANPTRRTPVVTIGLIAVCAVVFALELTVQSSDGEPGLARFFRSYGLIPATLTDALAGRGGSLPGALVPVLTSMFVHADLLHIGFNLLFLWIFGNNIEDRLGRPAFLGFYLAGGVVAAAAQVVAAPDSGVPIIGASGAIAAVLGAYLVLYPRARVLSLVYFGLFFQLLRLPAVALLGLWFVIQVIGAIGSSSAAGDGGVALFAHVGGFVLGVLVGLVLRGAGSPDPSRSLRPSDRFGVG